MGATVSCKIVFLVTRLMGSWDVLKKVCFDVNLKKNAQKHHNKIAEVTLKHMEKQLKTQAKSKLLSNENFRFVL